MAIFGLIAASMASLSIGGSDALNQSGEYVQAQALAQEGIEALRSLRDAAWNTNTFSTSAVAVSGGAWSYAGEGTTETIGKYTRTISFDDVCRDGSNDITTCPGTYTDLHTKLATVDVAWQSAANVTNTVQRIAFLSNWDSREWTQTDWSGGSGQSVWSNATRYDSDDGNVVVSTAGQVSLVSSGNGCGTQIWPFTTAGNYTYVSSSIEVASGLASLVSTGGGISGIENAVVDSLEFNASNAEEVEMVHVTGDIYAIAYRGPNDDGWVSTVNIDADGTISNSIIDSLEFDNSDGRDPSLVQIDTDTYAVAYEGDNSDGWIATFDIDASGNIGSVIDTLEFNTSDGEEPSMVHVTGDIYAIAYRGPSDDGWLTTVTIDASGNVSNSVIDSLEFNTSQGREPDLIAIDSGTVAVAYRGPNDDGFLSTIEIDGSGNIAASVTETYEYNTSNGEDPHIINISGDVYAIAHRGNNDDGWIYTIDIDSGGDITTSLIDSLEFDNDDGKEPSIALVAGTTYAVAYRGDGDDGFLTIFDIQTNGTIDNAVTETYEFDTSATDRPFILRKDDGTVIIAYTGPNDDGFVISIDMTSGATYPTTNPTIQPTDSFEVSSIGVWTSFVETATKNGGEIYYQLSDNDGSTWQYWNGAAWAAAGASNYNTATIVNTNISAFSTSSEQIVFQAFLESDGTQLVQLDEIRLSCEQSFDWPFTTAGNYTYVSSSIEVTGGVAQLISSGGGGINGIENATVDTFEFDTSNGRETDFIPISGNVYAIASRGAGTDGFIDTVEIDSSGNITNSIIDTLEFDTSRGRYPDLIHVTGDIYAVAYSGNGDDGWLATVEIDSSGNITNSVIDTLEFDTSFASYPDIVQVAGEYYAIAYQGPGNDGWLATVQIDSSGNISNSVVSSYEYDTGNGREPSILQISSSVFAIASRGGGSDGFIDTVSISAIGIIFPAVIDSLEYDTSYGGQPNLLAISGDVYAVVYRGNGDDGWLRTVEINAAGVITNTVIDSLEFDTAEGRYPEIINASGDNYLIVYRGPNNDGFVSLVDITSAGAIGSVIDTLEFDTSNGSFPNILSVGGNFFAIAYQGAGSDGWVATIELGTSSGTYPTDRPSIYPTTSFSVSGVDAWNSFTESATKNGGEIYYQLSDDNGTTWQYWTGSAWATAGASNFNTATTINTNINVFATSSGQIAFQAFLESDGSQLVQLDNVRIAYGESSGGSGFAAAGFLVSSAFDMSDASPVQILDWDQTIPSCTPACTIQLQLRTAPDSGGSPGTWTSWYGSSGAGTYFTSAAGTLVPTALNGNQWVQYRAELAGDGSNTPTLTEVRVNYK